MNSVRWTNLSFKYQRFTPSGGKKIGIRKSEFVTKTQFLSAKLRIEFRESDVQRFSHIRVQRFQITLCPHFKIIRHKTINVKTPNCYFLVIKQSQVKRCIDRRDMSFIKKPNI